MSKVTIFHSPVEFFEQGFGERITIALKEDVDNNNEPVYKYGISICSTKNNFDREVGRCYAQQRLEKNFAEFKLNEFYKEKGKREFLPNLMASILSDTNKYKRRLEGYKVFEIKPLQKRKVKK